MSALSLFPTIPDNLEVMDSRRSLVYLNTFMKNTLIRGYNRIIELAPLFNASNASFSAFLEYVGCFYEVAVLHREGDEKFFDMSLADGKALKVVLGRAASENSLQESLKGLKKKVDAWIEKPESYKSEELVSAMVFGRVWHDEMRTLLSSIDAQKLENAVSDEKLRSMIKENVEWLGAQSDIAVLLPFVLSHHDLSTSKFWPTITEEGLAALPMLVQIHAACWKLAPFDPVSRDAQVVAISGRK